MRKRIMILGASSGQVPMIKKARELGYETVVVDGNSNSVGFKEADIPVTLDIFQTHQIIRLAEEKEIQGITTMATNLVVRVVAFVADNLNLPAISPNSAFYGTSKWDMRRVAKDDDSILFAEGGKVVSNISDAKKSAQDIGFPIILKPIDASGCRGVRVVDKVKDIQSAFNHAKENSEQKTVLIEKFYEKALVFGVDSIPGKFTTYHSMISDKVVRVSPTIASAGINAPSSLTVDQRFKAFSMVTKLNKILGVNIGGSHVDFVLDGDNPRIIDYAPRLAGGSLIFHLIKNLTGIDMIKCVIKQAMGEFDESEVDIDFNYSNNKLFGIDRFFFPPISGIFKDFQIQFPQNSIGEVWIPSSGEVSIYSSNRGRLGWVSMVGENKEQIQKDIDNSVSNSVLEIKKGEEDVVTVPLVYHV